MVEDDNWNRIIDNKLRPYRFLIRVGNFFAVIWLICMQEHSGNLSTPYE